MFIMTDEAKFKPCPFCGGTHYLQIDKVVVDEPDETDEVEREIMDGAPEAWFVVCGACGAMGPMKESTEEATAGWNMREG